MHRKIAGMHNNGAARSPKRPTSCQANSGHLPGKRHACHTSPNVMHIGSFHRIQDFQQAFSQGGKILIDGVPNDFHSNAFVIVYNAVTQTVHLMPGYVRVGVRDFCVQCVARQFSDLKDVENACLLEHPATHKSIKTDAFTVFESVVDMGYQFAKGLFFPLIAHR